VTSLTGPAVLRRGLPCRVPRAITGTRLQICRNHPRQCPPSSFQALRPRPRASGCGRTGWRRN